MKMKIVEMGEFLNQHFMKTWMDSQKKKRKFDIRISCYKAKQITSIILKLEGNKIPEELLVSEGW
jgi:hypothetical protein